MCEVPYVYCRVLAFKIKFEFLIVPIRLANGSSSSNGNLEIYQNATWNLICGDFWETREANVACRQLGFGEALNIYTSTYFGESSGSLLKGKLTCDDKETAISNCSYSEEGFDHCTSSAGVECKGIDAAIYHIM